MNLEFEIKNVKIKPCIMNASGPVCTELDELISLVKSNSGAIVTKSTTIDAREGNPGPRYKIDDYWAIQSMGLPNPGYKEMGKRISVLKEKFNKPIIASIAGFSAEEYGILAMHLSECGADAIEVNLSCPNIVGKAVAAYDPTVSKEILENVRQKTDKIIGVKLPSYPDPILQKEIAEILLELEIDFVTAINSIGNSLILNPSKEESIIKPVWGGLCGLYIKPVALGTIYRFYKLFDGKIKIIGVGGISTGTDIFEFLLAGANAVQIGVAYEKEGINIFERLENELKGVLESKGYSSAEKAVGKLKIPDK